MVNPGESSVSARFEEAIPGALSHTAPPGYPHGPLLNSHLLPYLSTLVLVRDSRAVAKLPRPT